GEERGPRHALEGELPRPAHLRRVRLDRDGEHDAIQLGGDRASVVGPDIDAERAELLGDLAALALVEGPVGALDPMAPRAHQARRRRRPAGPGDTRKVVAPEPILPSLPGKLRPEKEAPAAP